MTPTEELVVLLGMAAKATGEAEDAEFEAHHGHSAHRAAQEAHKAAERAWWRVLNQADAAVRGHQAGEKRCRLAAERAAA